MPENNDDIELENIEERELPEPLTTSEPMPIPAPEPILAPEPVQSSKWEWIGSPSRPEAKEHSDGISDLFTVTDEDVGAGADVDDLVTVDMEKDILDADEDGSLDDLVDVTEEDIMGSDDYGQPPSRNRKRLPRRGTIRRLPPTSLGGMRG